MTSECCDELVCMSDYRCGCPLGYKWSSDFGVCYQCPTDWVFFKGNCYRFSTETTPVSWDYANEACANSGGQLITFKSSTIIEKIREFNSYFDITDDYYVFFLNLLSCFFLRT